MLHCTNHPDTLPCKDQQQGLNQMSKSPFWNEEWMKVQQDYWKQWSEMSQRAAGMAAPAKSPWEQSMEHWWQAVAPNADRSASALMEKMMDQGKQFFRMVEGLQQGLNQEQDWTQSIDSLFTPFQSQLSDGLHAAMEQLNRSSSFWQSPLEQWQAFASKAIPYASDPFSVDLSQSMGHLSQFLGAPGLGYSRETEEEYKQLLLSWSEYQKALQHYMESLIDLAPLSVERLKQKIEALQSAGEKVGSARQLFDLWTTASEEVYGERTITPEYAKVHGELVNALMRVKQKSHDLIDDRLIALGIPSQREMRTMQDRLQETRRELRSLRSEMRALKRAQSEAAAAAEQKTDRPQPAQPQTGQPQSVKKAAVKKSAVKKAATKKRATRKKASVTK